MMRSIVWTLDRLTAARFARDLEEIAWSVARRPRADAWMRLAQLASDARWCTDAAGAVRIASDAAHRSRAYARVGGLHGRALAAWYRALALVMFAAARWRGGAS